VLKDVFSGPLPEGTSRSSLLPLWVPRRNGSGHGLCSHAGSDDSVLDEQIAYLTVRSAPQLLGVVPMSKAHRQDGWGAAAPRDALDIPKPLLDA